MVALQDLMQETIKIAVSSGPAGVSRGLQAMRAFFEIGQETLISGKLYSPPVILRSLFEKLGATYIKLGQFIASTPSLFPDEYVLEFQKCLDQTPSISFRPEIKKIIEEELGRPISDVFSEINETPLASGSIAQVHSAVLKDSGKRVVLKVLKPGVAEILTTDMNFLYLLSRYLALITPEVSRLSLTEIMSDIRYSMMEEVDFDKEVEHIATFSSYLDSENLRSIATCPYVYRQFSSKRLIVMEQLEGVPLTDLESIRKVTKKDPEGVLIAALNCWFGSVVRAESFHADVHAGNLLVLRDGRVGFLDFGIVGRISPVTFKAIEALVTSMAVGDYETMARALATIGATDTDVDFKSFSRDLEAFFAELEQINSKIVIENDSSRGGPGLSAAVEVDQTQLNRLFLSLVRIGERQGIRFPREFGLFLKQILYFDRYTRILAPSLKILNDERINVNGISRSYGVGLR